MKLLMMTGAAAALALTIGASAARAGDKWDGADDLPTNPLACDSSGGGTVAAKPYDGGQPTGAPNKAGKEITLVDVPLQRFLHSAELKMSRQEMKDEQKETDGNPQMKGRIRTRQREQYLGMVALINTLDEKQIN